jgi:hypothetical protein
VPPCSLIPDGMLKVNSIALGLLFSKMLVVRQAAEEKIYFIFKFLLISFSMDKS